MSLGLNELKPDLHPTFLRHIMCIICYDRTYYQEVPLLYEFLYIMNTPSDYILWYPV